MKIRVSQEHINAGVRKDENCCPLALAISEATGKDVWVGTAYAHESSFAYELPMDAWNWRIDFDNGMPVEPFEFELPISAGYEMTITPSLLAEWKRLAEQVSHGPWYPDDQLNPTDLQALDTFREAVPALITEVERLNTERMEREDSQVPDGKGGWVDPYVKDLREQLAAALRVVEAARVWVYAPFGSSAENNAQAALIDVVREWNAAHATLLPTDNKSERF